MDQFCFEFNSKTQFLENIIIVDGEGKEEEKTIEDKTIFIDVFTKSSVELKNLGVTYYMNTCSTSINAY